MTLAYRVWARANNPFVPMLRNAKRCPSQLVDILINLGFASTWANQSLFPDSLKQRFGLPLSCHQFGECIAGHLGTSFS